MNEYNHDFSDKILTQDERMNDQLKGTVIGNAMDAVFATGLVERTPDNEKRVVECLEQFGKVYIDSNGNIGLPPALPNFDPPHHEIGE